MKFLQRLEKNGFVLKKYFGATKIPFFHAFFSKAFFWLPDGLIILIFQQDASFAIIFNIYQKWHGTGLGT